MANDRLINHTQGASIITALNNISSSLGNINSSLGNNMSGISNALWNISTTLDNIHSLLDIVDTGGWWVLHKYGELEIYRDGDMPDYYTPALPPWDSHKAKIISVRFFGNVSVIGANAFNGCSELMEAGLPDNVTVIGAGAFQGCASLTRVGIPGSVTSIGTDAFNGCAALADVYYDGSAEDWSAVTIGSNNEPLTSANIHYNGGGGMMR